MENDPVEETPGHLGRAWEVGVVIAIVVVILILVATAIFQYRRKQRRKQQLAELEAAEHARTATSSRSPSSFERNKEVDNLAKPPPTASSSKRSSRVLYPEHPSQRPPKYYWTER
ncbi:hypothetical protein Moror_9988 [Moniliophthora roreri MCA 2997]|uniref:Uncharacterized protein n=2 Tax=Moniliophthora roreri TaxID=221103 RepID=V2WZN0_MONRO|nr:hypothetical protein Moror_9988 [Moniliophthora roreri MCA 2997]KAI3615321.1 hypothetical protein WG66_003554 [Moniliophthora roreri]